MSLSDIVHEYIDSHIHLEAPEWYINPDYKLVMGSKELSTALYAFTPLTFADGLAEAVESGQPPSLDFFMSTPQPKGKFWAIYAVLLVKDGCEPALYIGSGTDALKGYSARIKTYYDKDNTMLPRHVRCHFKRGYELAHAGVLCWSPIPKVTMMPRSRLRFMALEGAFTHLFFTARRTCMDAIWTGLVPWSQDAVLWHPLNTHTPFLESTADLDLSEEDLALKEVERKRRGKEHSKKAYAKNWMKMREQYDAERAQDIVAFRLKKRKQAISWRARNGERAEASIRNGTRKYRAKVFAERRHECKPCNKNFSDAFKLSRHKRSTVHKNKIAGVPPTKKMLEHRRRIARLAVDKTWYCAPCKLNCQSQSHLDLHLRSNKHPENATPKCT